MAPATVLRWLSMVEAYLPEPGQKLLNGTPVNWITTSCWAIGCLCLATFWGVGQQHRWIRFTGLLIALFNLFVFPPLGLTGLVTMRRFARYSAPGDIDRESPSEETTFVQIGRTTLIAILLIAGYRWMDSYADQLGIGGMKFTFGTLIFILCGQVLVAFVHELGHALAARALGFRFPVFRVGPLSWSDGQLHVHLRRLFAHDSYLAGIPGSTINTRWDLIATAAAGPFLSLLLSMALFLGMLQSASTGDANSFEGRVLGILALLFALDFSMNMLPLGYSDARILVDLLSNNRRGRNMVRSLQNAAPAPPTRIAQARATSATPRAGALLDPVSQQRELVNELVHRGVVGGLPLATATQELGIVELLAGNSGAAKEHLERSLELLSSFPSHQSTGRSWLWLEKLHRLKQNGVHSHYAYGRAVADWEAEKQSARKSEDVAQARVALALLHLGQGELGSAVEELEQAEPYLPRETANPILNGLYHQAMAIAGFRMRWLGKSRQHAWNAFRAFTESSPDPAHRGRGLLHAGDLARDLWLTGQGALACEFLETVACEFAAVGAESPVTHLTMLRAEILAKTGYVQEALAELDTIAAADAIQERRIAEILGWASLSAEEPGKAATYFEIASDTLDERERARLMVAASRALLQAGDEPRAVSAARAACNVLVDEEHGEAGVALLLLAAQTYRHEPDLVDTHPFFVEGRRIVHTARFQPSTDKYLALNDLKALYEGLNRPVELAEIHEEIRNVSQQMSWQPHSTLSDADIPDLEKTLE
ncbi:hypothetical protein F183_A06810 [Bryobacterales bacterium F-183]|nr:hypothetical protein F183_A06810 [Bryobacterales bacterium F-183]